MHWHNTGSLRILCGLHALFRVQVNGVPKLEILPALHKSEIKGSQPLPYFLEMSAITSVAAEIDLFVG